VVSEYLRKRKEEYGIYVTLEETRESLLNNINNIGIKENPQIQVSDIASFMMELDKWQENILTEKDYLEMILEKASRPLRIYDPIMRHEEKLSGAEKRPSVFVLDSFNALHGLVYRSIKDVRKEVHNLLFKLRQLTVTSFIIMEADAKIEYRPEFFLVDGIIKLGIEKGEDRRFRRFVRVLKMRSCKHSIDPFIIEVKPGGIAVVDELI
jgi:KaiC/GvpD/RAD55 family RecA-like ATPase